MTCILIKNFTADKTIVRVMFGVRNIRYNKHYVRAPSRFKRIKKKYFQIIFHPNIIAFITYV